MSITQWIRLIWESPEEQAKRRHRDFALRMWENPEKTISESLQRGVDELRRRGKLRDNDLHSDDDLPKAA